MSSDIFAGNQNNVARSISNMWIGDENNIARRVRGVFIGDSNNTAKKIWPNSVVPSSFQQVEYLKLLDSTTMFDTGISIKPSSVKPSGGQTYYFVSIEVVMTCSFPNGHNTNKGSLFDATRISDVTSTNYTNYFKFGLDYDVDTSTSTPVSTLVFDGYFGAGEFIPHGGAVYNPVHLKTNRIEGILPNVRYTIDLNKQNQFSLNSYPSYDFLLYSTDGYYSISDHNTLSNDTMVIYRDTGNVAVKLYLFGQWISDTQNHSQYVEAFTPFPMILYDCKIGGDINNNIRRDFYPCYRKSDNVIGLYDMVDRLFMPSGHTVGDGSIELGPIA